MNDSCANVFCSRSGDRSGPVKNTDGTVCAITRCTATVPVPDALPPTRPLTYEGTALLLLKYRTGAGDGVRAWNGAGSNPASMPVTTFPGWALPGRPPRTGDHASYDHAAIPPCSSSAACSSMTIATP